MDGRTPAWHARSEADLAASAGAARSAELGSRREGSSPGAALASGALRNRRRRWAATPAPGRKASLPAPLPPRPGQATGGLQRWQHNVQDQHRHVALPTLHTPGTRRKRCSQLYNKNNSRFCLRVTYLLSQTFMPKIITNEQHFSLL